MFLQLMKLSAGTLPLLSSVADGIHATEATQGPTLLNNTILSSEPRDCHTRWSELRAACSHDSACRKDFVRLWYGILATTDTAQARAALVARRDQLAGESPWGMCCSLLAVPAGGGAHGGHVRVCLRQAQLSRSYGGHASHDMRCA